MQKVSLAHINETRLIGRVTKEVELRYTESGVAVLHFNVAINKRYKAKDSNEWKDQVDFAPITVWNGRAEKLAPRLHKGTALYIIGEFRSNSYTNKEGQKITSYGITAERVQVLTQPMADGSETPVQEQLETVGASSEEVPF